MIKSYSVVILTIFLVLASVYCDGKKGARRIWKDVLKKCAETDVLGKNVLYFGPSLGQGPGSIWRKKNDGGYNIRWKISSLEMPDEVKAIEGKRFSCEGKSMKTSKITPSLDLKKLMPVLEVEAKTDFQKAKKIEVSIDWARWYILEEGPYEFAIKENRVAKRVRDDLVNGNRFVITKALFVSGLTAELEFDSKTAIDIKGKYKKGVSVGAGLNVDWKGETKLKITSKSGFYIAGELTAISLTGLSKNKTIFGEQAKNLHKSYAGKDRF